MTPNYELIYVAVEKGFSFPSVRGYLNVVDIFAMPLTGNNEFNLNSVAVALNTKLKSLGEESFVETEGNTEQRGLAQRLDVVKEVIRIKQAKQAERANEATKRERIQALENALNHAKEQSLLSKTPEELQAMLDEAKKA